MTSNPNRPTLDDWLAAGFALIVVLILMIFM